MEVKYATAKNKANTREVQSMFSKAMCAYANWQDFRLRRDYYEGVEGKLAARCDEISFQSEYEATVKCLAMLTKEHLPEVCMLVIDACKLEFGI